MFPWSQVVNELQQKISLHEQRRDAGQTELQQLSAELEQSKARIEETEDRASKKRRLELKHIECAERLLRLGLKSFRVRRAFCQLSWYVTVGTVKSSQ